MNIYIRRCEKKPLFFIKTNIEKTLYIQQMEPIIIGVIVFGVVAYTFGVYMACTRLCRRNVDPLLVNPDYVDFTTVYPEK